LNDLLIQDFQQFAISSGCMPRIPFFEPERVWFFGLRLLLGTTEPRKGGGVRAKMEQLNELKNY